MKYLLIVITFISASLLQYKNYAQELSIKEGKVAFIINTPAGELKAHNSSVSGNINLSSGEVAFKVLISGFVFDALHNSDAGTERLEKATERLLDYYLEAEQYPEAVFKGKIQHFSSLKNVKTGQQTITVVGVLTIHGSGKPVEVPLQWTVNDDKIRIRGTHEIMLEDFGVRIPKSLISTHMMDRVSATIDFSLQ